MFIACKKNSQIKYICEEYVRVIQQMSCNKVDKKCYIYPLLFFILVSVIYFFCLFRLSVLQVCHYFHYVRCNLFWNFHCSWGR